MFMSKQLMKLCKAVRRSLLKGRWTSDRVLSGLLYMLVCLVVKKMFQFFAKLALKSEWPLITFTTIFYFLEASYSHSPTPPFKSHSSHHTHKINDSENER
jgi:hypothetical protein